MLESLVAVALGASVTAGLSGTRTLISELRRRRSTQAKAKVLTRRFGESAEAGTSLERSFALRTETVRLQELLGELQRAQHELNVMKESLTEKIELSRRAAQ